MMCDARKVLLLCVLAVAAGAAAFGQTPAGKKITAVEFKGAKALQQEKLAALTKARAGQDYDAEVVREDVKSLSKAARKVEARRVEEPGGIRLIYEIEENPVVHDVSFVGNTRISTGRLRATLPVKKGQPLEVDAVAKCRQKILKEYHAAGHTKTSVRVETLARAGNEVDLRVVVDEGKRFKVKEVKIVGASKLSRTLLHWKMQTKGSWAFFKNYFDETAFDEDLQEIARSYWSYGYFDASVKPGEFIYDEAKQSVTPVIQIEEGPRYTLAAVDVRGSTIFETAEVQAPFLALLGRPFDASALNKAVEKVKGLYANEGYLLAQVNEDYEFDKKAAGAKMILAVDERNRVRVGDVVIEREKYDPSDTGSGVFANLYNKIAPPVKDETIRREVQLKPGEVYRKSLERDTVDRLDRLGIFDSVKAHSEPTNDPAVRNLVLDVDEGVTGNIIFGVGYGDDTGAYVFGSYTEKNLFGEARDLQARALLGTKAITADIGYLDRYWRGDKSLGINLYKTAFTRIGYDEDELGMSAEIGKPINEHLRAHIRGRVGYAWFKDRNNTVDEELNPYAIATGRFRMVRDITDSKVWPTRGSVMNGGVEAGYAGGPLVKGTAGYAKYKTITGNWIYALNAQGGLMPFKAGDVGIGERFFLGGSDDLRGFAFRGAGPKDSGSDKVPIGGSTKLLVQNELRYTLLNNLGIGKRETPLRGLVFADTGFLGRDPLQIGSPRASVGTGLRMDMNRVNVGVDFALPVLKQQDDRTQFLHFKISSAF